MPESEDFLSLLGLTEDDIAAVKPKVKPRLDPSASPTALIADQWHVRRGHALSARPGMAAPTSPAMGADCSVVTYEPELVWADTCADPVRASWLKTLSETPEFIAARSETIGRPFESLELAERLMRDLGRYLRDRGEDPVEEPDGPDGPRIDSTMRRSVSRAAGSACELAGELADIRAALGGDGAGGSGSGSGGGKMNDPIAVARAFEQFRQDPALKRIAEIAGRLRRFGKGIRRRRTRQHQDEVTGVEPQDDPVRLLPQELALWGQPSTKYEAVRRLIAREAFGLVLSGHEHMGKGPVVVVLDESGSMAGARVELAKGVALAIAWIAAAERRWVALAAYSGSTGERLLALPPGRWDVVQLAEWSRPFIGGGSHLDVPIRELPEWLPRLGAPKGMTDVIIISDCICNISAADAAQFAAWKLASQVKVLTLTFRDPGDLASLSDAWFQIDTGDTDQEGLVAALEV